MATKVSAKAGEYQHLPLPPVEELYSSTNLETAEEKYYVTTAINYTNGPPHIGHAYEALLADVIARYNRAYGRKVFFMTGTDEHGQKIAKSAEVLGITPKESCDKWVEKFQSLNKRLSISNNRYIRTTDEYHEDSSRELWRRCTESGDIYLSKYTGWYNEREEMFVTDSDAKAADYKDAHGTPFKEVSEECYFFKLSSFRDRIIEHLKANPDFIQPESRKQEVEAMLDEIPDLCVSRTTFDWGIKLPADCAPGHVMYVWFDALTNYLSGTKLLLPEAEGTDEERALWPADVHVIGKDITRFHCIYWPAMLMSAKLPLPKVVAGHGFVMDSEGRKMSKSVGNVVDPNEVLDKYPADTLRFYICNEASYGTDLKFSVDNLITVHNNDLADTYGNLAQRSTLLLGKEKGHEWEVPEFTDEMERPFNLDELRTEVDRLMKGYKTKEALQEIMGAARKTNNWLGTVAPWKMKGAENDSKRRSVLRLSLEAVYILSHFLSPFLPYITTLVFRKIGKGGAIKDLNPNFLNLKAGTKVGEGPWDVAGDVEMKVLFPVLTKAEDAEEEKKEEKPKPKPKKEKKEKKEEKAAPSKGKKKDDKPKADELPEFVEGWRVAVKQDLAQCYYLSGVEEKKYPEVSGIMTLTAEGCFDQSIYGAVGEEGKFITHTEKGALPVLTTRVGGYKYNQKEAKFTLKPHHSTNAADLSKDTPPTFTAHIDKTGVLRLTGEETSFWTRKRQV